MAQAIRDKTAVTNDYENYAAAALSGSGQLSLLKDALRLEAANADADEVPSYEDAMDQASGYLHLVETYGSGLDGLAAASGASAKQRGVLRSSTAAASALVTIANSSGNPLMLANGYTGMTFAAMTLLTYAMSDDDGDASEGIFEALSQIAEELHAMRLEMHRRLDRLDAVVSEGFTPARYPTGISDHA